MADARLLALALAVVIVGSTSASRTEVSFDDAWLFHRGACPGGDRGTARAAALPPAAAGSTPSDPCAAPAYDDSRWRSLAVPHDWSREDLPARNADTEYPVVAARYGPWKLMAGDNASWASPTLDDSGWTTADGGKDWRTYGTAFEAVNATGWYRQHLPSSAVPSWMLKSTQPVALSLGIIAGTRGGPQHPPARPDFRGDTRAIVCVFRSRQDLPQREAARRNPSGGCRQCVNPSDASQNHESSTTRCVYT